MDGEGKTSKVDGVWRICVGLSLVPAFGTLYQRLTLPESTRFKEMRKGHEESGSGGGGGEEGGGDEQEGSGSGGKREAEEVVSQKSVSMPEVEKVSSLVVSEDILGKFHFH